MNTSPLQTPMTMKNQRSSHIHQTSSSDSASTTSSLHLPSGSKAPADIALQLRRMKRRLFLELVNGGGSDGSSEGDDSFSYNNDSVDGALDGSFRSSYHRCPSNASMGSTKTAASRSRLSRTDSNVSGLFFSSRSIDGTSIAIAQDENGEI